jgi:hypothetical protein
LFQRVDVLKKLDVVVFVGVPDMASMTAKWCAMCLHITCVTVLDPAIQLKSQIVVKTLDCRIKSGNDAVGMIRLEK